MMGTDKQTRATYRSILNQLETYGTAKSVM